MSNFRFIAGVAAGALAIIAFNNRKSIKKSVVEGVEKTKEVASEVKESAKATLDCIKTKKETKAIKEEA